LVLDSPRRVRAPCRTGSTSVGTSERVLAFRRVVVYAGGCANPRRRSSDERGKAVLCDVQPKRPPSMRREPRPLLSRRRGGDQCAPKGSAAAAGVRAHRRFDGLVSRSRDAFAGAAETDRLPLRPCSAHHTACAERRQDVAHRPHAIVSRRRQGSLSQRACVARLLGRGRACEGSQPAELVGRADAQARRSVAIAGPHRWAGSSVGGRSAAAGDSPRTRPSAPPPRGPRPAAPAGRRAWKLFGRHVFEGKGGI
jgi:hypothetical protein